eukprot:4630135-Amphidinium_carterae.1
MRWFSNGTKAAAMPILVRNKGRLCEWRFAAAKSRRRQRPRAMVTMRFVRLRGLPFQGFLGP